MTEAWPRSRQTQSQPEQLKHVIDQYRHRAERVTCVCGWEGSTATRFGEPSDWMLHVKASKVTTP